MFSFYSIPNWNHIWEDSSPENKGRIYLQFTCSTYNCPSVRLLSSLFQRAECTIGYMHLLGHCSPIVCLYTWLCDFLVECNSYVGCPFILDTKTCSFDYILCCLVVECWNKYVTGHCYMLHLTRNYICTEQNNSLFHSPFHTFICFFQFTSF